MSLEEFLGARINFEVFVMFDCWWFWSVHWFTLFEFNLCWLPRYSDVSLIGYCGVNSPERHFPRKLRFVRLRVLVISEWDTVLKAVHKVHAVTSVLSFASGACCMLQPPTIYPPPQRRFSTFVLKHDCCYYLKQFCLHSLFLYISGCKDKICVFCAMREAIFARRGTACFQSGSTPKFTSVLGQTVSQNDSSYEY